MLPMLNQNFNLKYEYHFFDMQNTSPNFWQGNFYNKLPFRELYKGCQMICGKMELKYGEFFGSKNV